MHRLVCVRPGVYRIMSEKFSFEDLGDNVYVEFPDRKRAVRIFSTGEVFGAVIDNAGCLIGAPVSLHIDHPHPIPVDAPLRDGGIEHPTALGDPVVHADEHPAGTD